MSALGLANPWGALALGAVAVLVALHLLERRRRDIPVASLLLWRRAAPAAPRRRLRPHLLFLVQLALLLALIGGYLRPYREIPGEPPGGRRLLLVLDVSASMQARESGGTRFDLVRRRAHDRVAALGSADEVMLLAAAERPRVAVAWSTDHARVRGRLEALEPIDAAADLVSALELALGEARARPATAVVVLTDLPPGAGGLPPAGGAVEWVQVGRTDDNLSLASLIVEQPPFAGPEHAAATVVVRNHSRRARAAALEAAVDGEPWARRRLALGPRASEVVRLERPPRAGTLRVDLDGGDALAADDRALARIAAARPLDLVLVSASRELAAAMREVAAAMPGGRVEAMSPDEYLRAPPAGGRVVVFDRVAPPGASAANALYVAPPAGGAVCPSAGPVARATVVDWDAEHPVLGGGEAIAALAPAPASRLVTPPWGRAVVVAAAEREAFPLLVAGERGGRRVVCLGAELTPPLASSDRLPLLVLALGALRWLGEEGDAAALVVDTGVPVAAPALVGPAPAGLRLGGAPPVLLAERAGAYRVPAAGGERLVLANFFDDRESDIGREGEGTWPAAAAGADASGTRRQALGWWLYVAGAALLAVEWALWLREARA